MEVRLNPPELAAVVSNAATPWTCGPLSVGAWRQDVELLRVESLDDQDASVIVQLGYAVARAQLLELAMVKLLEVQRQDTALALDERWDEIGRWLRQTAGQLTTQLGVPATVAGDFRALVDRRNRVAHRSWTDYLAAREVAQGASVAKEWATWLADQAAIFGRAYNGAMDLTRIIREKGAEAVTDADLETLWREHVPEPVEPPFKERSARHLGLLPRVVLTVSG